MDRPSRHEKGPHAAEPHARGDGPVGDLLGVVVRSRAPRTWGWTAAIAEVESRYKPSPTHVGMDRGAGGVRGGPGPEPHARGDGPALSLGDAYLFVRAPRTWGWTDPGRAERVRVVPSPTHVGMDRWSTTRWRRSAAEPHARGDGPQLGAVSEPVAARAPRTWGWTASGFALRLLGVPSPTHVGMDRVDDLLLFVGGPEPHARGDGPATTPRPNQSYPRAPRTWGWTGDVPGWGFEEVPSPTHVGMDRGSEPCPVRAVAEPHARGDGPYEEVVGDLRRCRAPRTWGWTGDVPGWGFEEVPSPTHVGMDR